ncbi:unnamed protein product, partial [Sphacelaria rigidula]
MYSPLYLCCFSHTELSHLTHHTGNSARQCVLKWLLGIATTLNIGKKYSRSSTKHRFLPNTESSLFIVCMPKGEGRPCPPRIPASPTLQLRASAWVAWLCEA